MFLRPESLSRRLLLGAASGGASLALMFSTALAQEPVPPTVPAPQPVAQTESPARHDEPADHFESAQRQIADLRARIDADLLTATGLLQARLLDAQARAVAIENDLAVLPDVKGDNHHQRHDSLRDRAAELLKRMKFIGVQIVPPPPADIDTMIVLADGVLSDTYFLALADRPPQVVTVAHVTEITRLDFDTIRDGVARLAGDVARFTAFKTGDVRDHLVMAARILDSSQTDLRNVVDENGIFVVDRLESVADRIAEVRDQLADISGRFDEEPRVRLSTMRADAERLHSDLRAILEGRPVGSGPANTVKAERERVAFLSEQTNALIAGKQGAARDHLEAAKNSLAQAHDELGGAIDDQGNLIPDKMNAARATLSQAKAHMTDAGQALDGDAQKQANALASDVTQLDSDLAAIQPPSDANVRAATRPAPPPR